MKHFIIALLLSLFAISGIAADNLVDKVAASLQKCGSVTASYTISSGNERNSGTITVSGPRFTITSPKMSVWFDGKTQWTMVPADREVSVTEPTDGEVQQVNPFAVIGSYKRHYNTRRLRSSTAGKSVIEFIPKKGASSADGISKAVLTIDDRSLNPEKLVITMSSRSVVTITLSNLTRGATLPVDRFKPTKAQLKGYEIVDLR